MKNLSIYLFAILIAAFGCKSSGEEPINTEPEQLTDSTLINVSRAQFDKNNMELSSLKKINASEKVRATGIIDVPPENRVTVSPVMGGYVTYNPLLIGDRVKKGQRILSLENPEFVKLQQEYLEVKEELKYLEEEYARHKELLKENITSKKNYLKAESAYLTANARYHGLRKQLELLNLDPDTISPAQISPVFNIYSPITGSITAIDVTRGSYIAPSARAMEIVNNEHLHLELNIFEKDILKVKRGQHISFSVPESGNTPYPAEVHLISEALSRDRTIRIHGHIEDSLKSKLYIGMYVEAYIDTPGEGMAEEKQMAAPSSAVVERDGRFYMMILENENEQGYRFKEQPVTPGLVHDDWTVLQGSGLDTTTRVLSKGAFDVLR